jgi:hypothetical protein
LSSIDKQSVTTKISHVRIEHGRKKVVELANESVKRLTDNFLYPEANCQQ